MVENNKRHGKKKASKSPYGLYQFSMMVLKMKNACSAFQESMNVMLSSVKYQPAAIYLRDIVVFSETV